MGEATTTIIALALLFAAAVGGAIWLAVKNAGLRDEKREAQKRWAVETDKNEELLKKIEDGKERRRELDAEIERLQGLLAETDQKIEEHDDAVKEAKQELEKAEQEIDDADGWGDFTFSDNSDDKGA